MGDGSLAAGIAALLRRLFADLQEASVDEDVVEYLAAGLAEADEDDPDELCDSVAGFSPVFGQLVPRKQRQLIADLLGRVAALRLEQQGAPQAAAGQRPAQASVAAVAAEVLARLSSVSVSSSAASSEREEGDDELATPLSHAQRQALGALRELSALPDACDAFLAHVLGAEGGGDVEAAAAWMLEEPDLAAAQAAWQVARAARQAERARARAEQQASMRQIVDRFQLQALPNGSGGGKGKPPVLRAWGAGGGGRGGGTNKARYRDGALVSTRGEKYVVEKGPDWDGGSRGKVYTKGKRGKGYVG